MLPLPEDVCVVRFKGSIADRASDILGISGAFLAYPRDYIDILTELQNLADTNSTDLNDYYESFDTDNLWSLDNVDILQQLTGASLELVTLRPNIQPYVLLYALSDKDIPQKQRDTYNLHTEIHELCHANQYWHCLLYTSPSPRD